MEGGWGKASQGRGEGFGGERRERVQFPAMDGFGQKRSTSDGVRAAATEEADFANGSAFDGGGEMKDVATNRISDFDPCVGTRKFARVTGMLEVVEQRLAKHERNYRSGRDGEQSAWGGEGPLHFR